MFKITIELTDDETKEAFTLTRHYSNQVSGEHIKNEAVDMFYSLEQAKEWNGEFKVKKL